MHPSGAWPSAWDHYLGVPGRWWWAWPRGCFVYQPGAVHLAVWKFHGLRGVHHLKYLDYFISSHPHPKPEPTQFVYLSLFFSLIFPHDHLLQAGREAVCVTGDEWIAGQIEEPHHTWFRPQLSLGVSHPFSLAFAHQFIFHLDSFSSLWSFLPPSFFNVRLQRGTGEGGQVCKPSNQPPWNDC